jgi:pimeloyl-ACP methyl ester carboxylesterase
MRRREWVTDHETDHWLSSKGHPLFRWRRSQQLATVGLALASGFAACGLVTQAAQAATPGSLDWQTCSQAQAPAGGFQCATLQVPLDYTDPGGPQISLALIRHQATDPVHRVGSLVFNPGGPGGSGVIGLQDFYSYFPAAVRARFDIVSFDPRGIGGSDQLQCFASPDQENALLGQLPPAEFPVGAAQTQTEINVWSQFDQACASHGGPILDHMDTADVAHDMDQIRAALGEAKMDYYGISYGTYLGDVYANMFPSHAGHMVLDGNVAPVQWNDPVGGAQLGTFIRIQSPLGSETALQTFLSDCGSVAASACAFSAGTPAATASKYRALLAGLATSPAVVAGQSYDAALTTLTVQSDLETEQANSGLGTPGWSGLAQLLQALWAAQASTPGSTSGSTTATGTASARAAGVPSPALSRATLGAMPATGEAAATNDSFPSEITEGIYGVVCSDSPNPTDPQSYSQQAAYADSTQAPDGFGQTWAWFAEPCAQWQGHDSDRYAGPWNRAQGPLLLVGTLADPNTAYSGTLRAAAALQNARVITETGGGHTALVNPSDCINNATSAYLIRGTLPPAGTVCDQNQAPF